MTLENTPVESTEQHLVSALREGKPEAISLIYDKYAAVLLGLITRMVRSSEVAEAVLQETFLAIWDQKENYKVTQLRLLSWLILIARNTAIGALKSGKYTPHTPDRKPEAIVADNNDGFGPGNKVNDFIVNLSATEKTVLDLIYLKGYNCADAAGLLNIPEATLKITLKKACQHLRTGKAL